MIPSSLHRLEARSCRRFGRLPGIRRRSAGPQVIRRGPCEALHLRCKTSSTSAVRGQLQVLRQAVCGLIFCKNSSTSAVRGQLQVFQQWSCDGSGAVRSRVFAVQVLRQLPCGEVVLNLCWTSPPAEAVQGSRVFCSSLRQWPCEAVVLSSLYKLRQLPCEAVVSSLNKPSGRGRARQLYDR